MWEGGREVRGVCWPCWRAGPCAGFQFPTFHSELRREGRWRGEEVSQVLATMLRTVVAPGSVVSGGGSRGGLRLRYTYVLKKPPVWPLRVLGGGTLINTVSWGSEGLHEGV